ncbi:MAG: hypothetical protein E6I45_11925 [Chloroflexi bacterium]|nr:MAG: hypothetical protein E6I45_11925 [Chloroflexota bacterium]
MKQNELFSAFAKQARQHHLQKSRTMLAERIAMGRSARRKQPMSQVSNKVIEKWVAAARRGR